MSVSKKQEQLTARREARAWLSSYNRDFQTVCDYAGYDPIWMFQKIAHFIRQHDKRCARQIPGLVRHYSRVGSRENHGYASPKTIVELSLG